MVLKKYLMNEAYKLQCMDIKLQTSVSAASNPLVPLCTVLFVFMVEIVMGHLCSYEVFSTI